MKIAEINMYTNFSTGKIMMGIAECVRINGHTVKTFSAITYPGGPYSDISDHVYFGSKFGAVVHAYIGKLTGLNGFLSCSATKKLIRNLQEFEPDIVHLHNLHAFCINLPILFSYLKKNQIKVVWTLHDCWSFTGHCPHFQLAKCDKWRTGCGGCKQLNVYPRTYVDNTKWMWKQKKKLFSGLDMVLVTPSEWLAGLVKQSFLKEYPIKVINNGINLSVFKPTESDFRASYDLIDKKVILGVAAGWGERKGFDDCLQLAKMLGDDYRIVLVGVTDNQIQALPKNVIGIKKTNSQKELAAIYTAADVFINTTHEDNYPTVNLEARACGLPVVTYNTGGSPESAGKDAYVVENGDVAGLKLAIERAVREKKTDVNQDDTISDENKFKEYINLYECMNKPGGVFSFRRRYSCTGKVVLLGVAAGWGERKGLDVFIDLAARLDSKYQIVLVGTNEKVDTQLPSNIISIHRTQDQKELAEIYSAADLFVNPTREEVFGMVNAEALACGTPVVTFNTGGSPECIDDTCGSVVPHNDNNALLKEIIRICEEKPYSKEDCLKRAEYFDMNERFKEYLKLYEDCTHST